MVEGGEEGLVRNQLRFDPLEQTLGAGVFEDVGDEVSVDEDVDGALGGDGRHRCWHPLLPSVLVV